MDKAKDNNNNNTAPVKPKEKRRSNEKRKEKSRDAARCRRSRETEIFTELGQVLPLRHEDVEQLDKASIMRLSIAFLKVREMLKLFPKIQNLTGIIKDDKNENVEKKPFDLLNGSEAHKLMIQALDGFLMILSGDGDVTYVSENISEHLGISQIDILGQPVWEYSHQCDHEELKDALNMKRANIVECKKENKNDENLNTAHRDFFLRLKCTLTSRGRSVNIKSASYKVIHCTGHIVTNSAGDRILIMVGRPLPHPSNIEIPLGTTTFLTKHSLDMKFTYVDDKMLSLLDYQPDDLLGKSLYDCHHGGDSESLMTIFKGVLNKGQAETCRYRFLGKYGGYSWIVTQATMVYDKQKPQSVVCVNYVISEIENNNEIYSIDQLEANRKKEIIQQQQQQSKDQKQFKQQHKENISIKENQSKDNNNHHQSIETLKRKNIAKNLIKTCGSEQQQQQQPAILSPIRKIFDNKNCTITIPSIPLKPNKLQSIENHCPKSVTATVFKQVIDSDQTIQSVVSSVVGNLSTPTTTSSATTSATSAASTIPRAQSVTASVFSPLSAFASRPTNNRSSGGIVCGVENSSINDNKKSFVSRSEEMNKGFFMFSEDTPDLTMLKEEPDDLTHLAPTAGDACIPLDDSTPLFGEMLENLILPDSYSQLLTEDINSLDSEQSNSNNNRNHIDPFINYRDESSDTSNSPNLLSPGGLSKSPEISSLPSLCSPNSLSQDDEFAFMTMSGEDDIDLTMRAPYIPMNEQEDLPLLTEDFMWGAFPDELSIHKDMKDALQIDIIKNNFNLQQNNHNNISNDSNNNINNNNSSSNSDNTTRNPSSLAALLCNDGCNNNNNNNNMLNQTEKLSTEIKRRKLNCIENDSNLIDSIEAFGHVLNKNSTNVDCWTDLLHINSNNDTTMNQQHQQENTRHEKQNVMVNTATLQIPLIAIQNNNNNKNISNNSNNSCNNIINNSIINNSNNKIFHHQIESDNILNNSNNDNKKLITKILTHQNTKNLINRNHNNCININNNNNNTISNSINGCLGNNVTTTSTITNLHSNKRPANVTITTSESKRTKNLPHIEIQTSPQLLQQLMAPSLQRTTKMKHQLYDKGQTTSKWNLNDIDGQQKQQNLTSSSNSVLKNLLVSGCDNSFASRSPDTNTMMDDDSSLDSNQDENLTTSTLLEHYSRPLFCNTTTSTINLLRNYRSNPLIGGTGILPSPILPTDETNDCNSLKPTTITTIKPMSPDPANDSGIECENNSFTTSTTSSQISKNIHQYSSTSNNNNKIDEIKVSTIQLQQQEQHNIDENIKSISSDNIEMDIDNEIEEETDSNRKISLSFLDTEDPFCSPLLMDLCDDNYGVDETNDFLQDNEISKVLDEWTAEMT